MDQRETGPRNSVCPQCGYANLMGHKYCGKCRALLRRPPVLRRPSGLLLFSLAGALSLLAGGAVAHYASVGVNFLARPQRTPLAALLRTPTPAASLTLALAPLPSPTPLPSATRSSAGAPASTPRPSGPTPEPPVPAGPAPTATPSPQSPRPAAAARLGWGLAQPPSGGGAFLRTQPTTAAPAAGLIPLGERVEVLRIVTGEALIAGEPHWYEVQYRGLRGFVYFTLLKMVE